MASSLESDTSGSRSGRGLTSVSTAADDRSISPTHRTRSEDLVQHPTVSDSRSPSPRNRHRATDSDQQPTAADDPSVSPTDRTGSKDLDKHPTLTATLDGHPHLQHIRTKAHNAKQRLLHLESIHATGPSSRFNPTNVRVHIRWKGDSVDEGDEKTERRAEDERTFLWKSRDNRKRRNSSFVLPPAQRKTLRNRLFTQYKQTSKILVRMLSSFPYWDMAFWSGSSYTIGSILFVVDGTLAYMEATMPGSISNDASTYGGPLCFFIGALLYQLGAVMAYLEAVNDGSFRGSAMRRFIEGNEDHSRSLVDEKIHSFLSHFTTHRSDEETLKATPSRRGGIDLGLVEEGTHYTYNTWQWFPSWHMLKTHHVYELGYLACAIQLFGATLYGICGVVALPGILSSLEPWQKEASYWIPQIVASVCFLTASIMFTLETQEKWYRWEPSNIGWHIGIWAGIGSTGFLLLAIFGTMEYDYEWGAEQADLTTIWASTAYFFSSFLQWYEATDKREQNEISDNPEPIYAYPMAMQGRRNTRQAK